MTLAQSLEAPLASDPKVRAQVNAYLNGTALYEAYGPRSGRIWKGDELINLQTGKPVSRGFKPKSEGE